MVNYNSYTFPLGFKAINLNSVAFISPATSNDLNFIQFNLTTNSQDWTFQLVCPGGSCLYNYGNVMNNPSGPTGTGPSQVYFSVIYANKLLIYIINADSSTADSNYYMSTLDCYSTYDSYLYGVGTLILTAY